MPTESRPRSPAASERVAQLWALSSGALTPAPSLTTVLCRAGDTDIGGNWVMEEHLPKPLPRSRAASERVARRLYLNGITTGMVRSIFSKRIPTLTIENLRSLPEIPTPAPSLTTVLCRAGDGIGYGRLGNGGISQKYTPTLTSSLGTGRTAVALSSGYSHTCAILDNGAVSCWGRGNNGQLGNGATSDKSTPTLTSSLGTGRTAVALSSGDYHTCAILDNGAVSCWGRGNYGQLGNGGTSDKTTPTLTSSLGTGRTAVALSSGGHHTCAILDNGAVSCWGRGSYGQLGNGGTSTKTIPTLTSSLGTGRTAVALSSGDIHTCAILDNGAVSCWGNGHYDQLGNGATSDKSHTHAHQQPRYRSHSSSALFRLFPHLRHPRQRCCVVLGIRRLRQIG